ncbi:MAG: hypothetical protein LBQ57_13840, partial [Spirochaetales bacterium]|nr:hypothetical protein [Spirochaetales bacterium]
MKKKSKYRKNRTQRPGRCTAAANPVIFFHNGDGSKMKTLIIRAHFLRQSRKKPGFSLQSFGYAKRISASI